MQKIIFGIFAHPDDEAFGPAGTLLLETRAGAELHLITLTAGEGGANPDNVHNLAEVRLAEWHAAGQLLGATSMRHLGYRDGTLSNKDHLEITNTIQHIVTSIVEGREDISVEFMSIDLNGVTGHIDHIVAGRSACLAFCRLNASGLPIERIRLACIPAEQSDQTNTDFCYMEPGRKPGEIDETIDARSVLDEVKAIMNCHKTQHTDAKAQIDLIGDKIAVDNFIIKR